MNPLGSNVSSPRSSMSPRSSYKLRNGDGLRGHNISMSFTVIAASALAILFVNYRMINTYFNIGTSNYSQLDSAARVNRALRQTTQQEDSYFSQPQQQQQHSMLATSPTSAFSSPLLVKANSINSYWWPSAEDGGGILGRIHSMQNPSDCTSPSTKFFVWRSLAKNEKDTRGLTAWAHAAMSNLLHAFTDGDQFSTSGSRVLIAEDALWPMAKGCLHGPETMECYFEPLTSCTLSNVDTTTSSNATTLVNVKDEYDRSLRTIYSSQRIWYRITDNKYSWTHLPDEKDHSQLTLTAALIAYYFRPKLWLRHEIDKRIRQSIPLDINPDRTVGIPIRRSDKCHGHNITGSALGELECPPLQAYLDGLQKFMLFDPLIENVIVTSEDKSACDEFIDLLRAHYPTLRVIVNVGDVQQGTGSGSKLESYVEGAANADVIASALSSMHLHLRARYFVITSKSTWTSTITVMARAYGFASEIFAIDIGRNHNAFSGLAREGCSQ